MTYLAVIQARLYSSRFPNKVMATVKGKTMLRRVWDAAKESYADHVVVAWPERWPEIEENNLFLKFRELIKEFDPMFVIRLTADCPLLTTGHVNDAIVAFERQRRKGGADYYNNRLDGYDVQIFTPEYMYAHPHKEWVIADIPNKGGVSVNTKADLERVRQLAK